MLPARPSVFPFQDVIQAGQNLKQGLLNKNSPSPSPPPPSELWTTSYVFCSGQCNQMATSALSYLQTFPSTPACC